ncbi:MAG TPA: hypothetical protein VIT21_08960 [Chthoniobacterales bacterium]
MLPTLCGFGEELAARSGCKGPAEHNRNTAAAEVISQFVGSHRGSPL